MRELSDHWEDLRAEALAQGLSEENATARANARLGQPALLVESILAGLQRGSWIGRHLVMTLCVFPLLPIVQYKIPAHRVELNAAETTLAKEAAKPMASDETGARSDEGWNVRLLLFGMNAHKRILSQEAVPLQSASLFPAAQPVLTGDLNRVVPNLPAKQ